MLVFLLLGFFFFQEMDFEGEPKSNSDEEEKGMRFWVFAHVLEPRNVVEEAMSVSC